MSERARYLIELLDTTQRTVERQARRIEEQGREDRETLDLITHELKAIRRELEPPSHPTPTLATSITFKETQ